jgi:multidrug efflux pump subunit AcrA (membrane-fusion protein)
MLNSKRTIFSTTLLLIVLSVSINGCEGTDKSEAGKSGTNGKNKAVHVRAMAAKRSTLVEKLNTTGDVIAVNTVTLKSTVEGQIVCCSWREGDRVDKRGQKLVEIDRPMYRQMVLSEEASALVAKARLADLLAGARPEQIAQSREAVTQLEDCTEFAKADLARIGALVHDGSLSAESVEKARVSYTKCQTQLRSANEELAMLIAGPTKTEIAVQQAAVEEAVAKKAVAQSKLDECILRAPFPGVITKVFARSGDLSTPRAPLLELMDPTSIVFRFAIPETKAAELNEESEATIRLDAFPGKEVKAVITRIYAELERTSRTRLAEAKVVEPVDLIPGMFGRISVTVKKIENAITVPGSAIMTTPRGDKIVFVVKDGKAVMTKVTLGLEQANIVQITEGIDGDALVVYEGNLNLKNGTAVEVLPQPSSDSNIVGGGKR